MHASTCSMTVDDPCCLYVERLDMAGRASLLFSYRIACKAIGHGTRTRRAWYAVGWKGLLQ